MSAGNNSTWDSLVEFVNQKQAESQIPGLAVGIFNKGEVTAQGFGVTNIDNPLPVTDTTTLSNWLNHQNFHRYLDHALG